MHSYQTYNFRSNFCARKLSRPITFQLSVAIATCRKACFPQIVLLQYKAKPYLGSQNLGCQCKILGCHFDTFSGSSIFPAHVQTTQAKRSCHSGDLPSSNRWKICTTACNSWWRCWNINQQFQHSDDESSRRGTRQVQSQSATLGHRGDPWYV